MSLGIYDRTLEVIVEYYIPDGTKLAHANTSHEQPGQVIISAPLLEGNWYTFGEEATEPVTRTELMDVLMDLKAVMLRAHFHFDQDEVSNFSF